MSKETILAKIQSNLAGQGSMIDISGKLPEILAEIIELIPESGGVEPYFVQGAYADDEHLGGDTMIMVPSEEFARVKTAFLVGRSVIIPASDATEGLAYLVTGYSPDVIQEDETTPIEGFALWNLSKGLTAAKGAAIALIAEL